MKKIIMFTIALITSALAHTQSDSCLTITGDSELSLQSQRITQLKFDLLRVPADKEVKITISLIDKNQSRFEKNWRAWGRTTSAFTLGACAGFTRATREVLIINYDKFEARFPGANERFWNPEESWRNKWKNGDDSQGERFPGSSSMFVAFTDAYHSAPIAERFFYTGGCVVSLVGERRKWWRYAIDIAVVNIAYGLTSNWTYDHFYKMKNRQ